MGPSSHRTGDGDGSQFTPNRRRWVPQFVLTLYVFINTPFTVKCHTVSLHTRTCNFIYALNKRTVLSAPIFETTERPTALSARLLYGISPEWDNKCRKCGQQFIYASKHSMSLTAPIFTKFFKSWTALRENPLCRIRPNRSKHTESADINTTVTETIFHEIDPCLTFCEELLYRISWKSDKRISIWCWVTDGRGLHISVIFFLHFPMNAQKCLHVPAFRRSLYVTYCTKLSRPLHSLIWIWNTMQCPYRRHKQLHHFTKFKVPVHSPPLLTAATGCSRFTAHTCTARFTVLYAVILPWNELSHSVDTMATTEPQILLSSRAFSYNAQRPAWDIRSCLNGPQYLTRTKGNVETYNVIGERNDSGLGVYKER